MNIVALYRLMGGDGCDLFSELKKLDRQYIVSEGIRQYEPCLHDVTDKTKRPDKTIFKPTGERDDNGIEKTTTELVEVSRAPLSLQKYIISQLVSFVVGKGITLKPNNPDSLKFKEIYRNYYDNKTDFDLRKIATSMFSETQCAVIIYGEQGKTQIKDFRFKYKIVSPSRGDTLQPYWDEDTDDLIAFKRSYQKGTESRSDLYLMNESTGKCEIHRYINENRANIIITQFTKLPIAYFEQAEPECNDTAELISRYEKSINNFFDQNDYTGDPILFAKGGTINLPAKGVAGKFFEDPSGTGSLEFITPENATESRKLEFDMTESLIFTLNRAVKLDLNTLKGLGVESGAALERYLTDLYMKAEDKQMGDFGKGVQRFVNLLNEFWNILVSDDDLRVDAVFSKYSLTDNADVVELAMKANGGLPVITQATSITMVGLEENPNELLENKEGAN